MKEYYTYLEMLKSCKVVESRIHFPNLTWESLTYQHMVDYYYRHQEDEHMKNAMIRIASLVKYVTLTNKGDIFLGEIWFDKEGFPLITKDEFHDMMIEHINDRFELETALIYDITTIEITEEYHDDEDFDGYRVCAYGCRIEDESWLYEVENIYNTFFL